MVNFSFRVESKEFIFRCPSYFYDLNILKKAVLDVREEARVSYDVGPGNVLNIKGKTEGDVDALVHHFFAQLNNYPTYFDYDYSSFVNSEKPIISCIILLTCNDLFVINHLIPSIIKNSGGYPIEIITVFNGFGCDLGAFKRFELIESDFLWVSRAYNQGVKSARGEYVAIFHDDCILDDKEWIQKAIYTLNNDIYAMTGELKNGTAKCTPLVMRKKDYWQLGGFDEFYFSGNEDRDFSYTLYSNGKKIMENINSIHFQGVSTILLLSSNYEDFKKAISYNILPLNVLKTLNEFYLNQAFNKGVKVLMAKYMLYFNDKFKRLVFSSEEQYNYEKARLIRLMEENMDSPFLEMNIKNISGLLASIKT